MTENEENFYSKAAKYWATIPATIDGVLGGFGHISDIDIKGSKGFLHSIMELSNAPAKNLALDCGAGIGRVSKFLLLPYFEKVDLVEQDAKFVKRAHELIGKDNDHLGTIYNIGLQNFTPTKKYDLIWCQWVTGHLKDYDFINFLIRCANSLSENGVIVVKENITADEEIDFDDEDSSVTRPYKLMKVIFEEARLAVIKERLQTDFPNDIFSVYTFALVPKSRCTIITNLE